MKPWRPELMLCESAEVHGAQVPEAFLRGHGSGVSALSYQGIGKELGIGYKDGSARVWKFNQPAAPLALLEVRRRMGAVDRQGWTPWQGGGGCWPTCG